MSELRDLPGREHDLEQLGLALVSAEQGSLGRVVFVAGGPASGRAIVLRALAERLVGTRRGPLVLAGRFVDGRYTPMDEDPTARARVLGIVKRLGEAGEWIAGVLGDVGVPYAGLVEQVLARSARPLELLEGLAARPPSPELAPRLLSRLCRQRRVVWVVDDADLADGGGLWADLILGLADRINGDLPLVLVLGLDGPPRLGGHEDDESDSLYVARLLTSDGRALWHPLGPIDREELRRFTGPASRDVLESLLSITGGEPAWAGALWREWQRDGVVQDMPQLGWRFAAGGRGAVLDEVDALLGERLKRLIGEHDLNQLERARRVLACAALEGRRFTASAIADALELDRDGLIDFLDDTLTTGDRQVGGLLAEDGWVHVADEHGSRSLAMYRFARSLDWLTLARYGLTDNRRRFLAHRLADAIARHYGGHAHRVAHTLTRLYMLAAIPDRADYYRRMADIGTARQVILWRARNVLDGDEPAGRSERRRASQLLIGAAKELFEVGPFTDGLAFAQAAHRLAPLKGDQAMALRLSGSHRTHLGDYERARHDLLAGLDLVRDLGNREAEASTRQGLASIHFEQGDYESARRESIAVLDLVRALGNRDGEASTRLALASIDNEQGDYERARREYLAALELFRALGDRHGEASTRLGLASIGSKQGDYGRARREFLAALELVRQLGDRDGEAVARHGLARIDFQQGDYERARREFVAVLELFRELGDRDGEAGARQGLASIHFEQCDYESARREFLALLELRRSLGDRDGEAVARQGLASIDSRQGDYERARHEFLALLELRRGLGDRHGEAHTQHELALIDFRQGDYERARREFIAVLELFRELGDRDGEAGARHGLARIDFEQGDYERARGEFIAVLELRRELGDRHGEARTQHELARIDFEQGDYQRARREYVAVLELFRALGDRDGEAAVLKALARLDPESADPAA